MSDQVFKARPHRFKSVRTRYDFWFARMKKLEVTGKCEVCSEPVTIEDYEKGHVVPSRDGECGSNGPHNMLILCQTCNSKMKDVEASLYADDRERPSR
jgi:5-methylcytosine-specific restriction endonuclease McrA